MEWISSYIINCIAYSFQYRFINRIKRIIEIVSKLLTQSLWYLRIMHLWVVLGNFSTLQSRPNHECIHWSFDVLILGALQWTLPDEAMHPPPEKFKEKANHFFYIFDDHTINAKEEKWWNSNGKTAVDAAALTLIGASNTASCHSPFVIRFPFFFSYLKSKTI